MSAPPISRLVGERQVSVVRDAAAVWRVLTTTRSNRAWSPPGSQTMASIPMRLAGSCGPDAARTNPCVSPVPTSSRCAADRST